MWSLSRGVDSFILSFGLFGLLLILSIFTVFNYSVYLFMPNSYVTLKYMQQPNPPLLKFLLSCSLLLEVVYGFSGPVGKCKGAAGTTNVKKGASTL